MSRFQLRSLALAGALLPWLAAAAPLSLDGALDLAAQRSEAARAARAGAAGADELARAAGQLPDPMLSVGIDNLPVTGSDRFSTTRESMTQKRIGISQEWLSQDKRAARQAAAQASAGRERVQAQVAVAEARLQTALAYLDAFYAAEALKLTTLNEHHAHEELAASRARLASSSGTGADVLALTAAVGMSEDESADLRQQQRAAQATLQRWVGVAADDLLPVQALATPPEPGYVAAHPAVVMAQRDIELARQEAAVAATNRTPNWTWEVSYGQRTGYSDMVSVGVSIPLPVAPAERQDRDTAARLAMLDKAQANLAEAVRAAAAEYQVFASDAQRLQERIERYRNAVLIPTRQRAAAAMAGYRSNQASLVTLFEARHAEVEVQRKLLALQRDRARAEAQLALRPILSGATQ